MKLISGDTVNDAQVKTLFDSVVFPWLATRDFTPHGISNLPQFRRSLRRRLLAVTSISGSMQGLCLFQLRPASHLCTLQPHMVPLLKTGVVPVGLLRNHLDPLSPISRIWHAHLGLALSTFGVKAVTRGGDDGFVDPRYAPVILDKLRWAEGIALTREDDASLWTNPAAPGAPCPLVVSFDGQSLTCISADPQHERLAATLTDALRNTPRLRREASASIRKGA